MNPYSKEVNNFMKEFIEKNKKCEFLIWNGNLCKHEPKLFSGPLNSEEKCELCKNLFETRLRTNTILRNIDELRGRPIPPDFQKES